MADKPKTPVKTPVKNFFKTPTKTPRIYNTKELFGYAKDTVLGPTPPHYPFDRTPLGMTPGETQAFRIQQAANKGVAKILGTKRPMTPTPERRERMAERHQERAAGLAASLAAVQPKIDAMNNPSGMSPRKRGPVRQLFGRKSRKGGREGLRSSTGDGARDPAGGLLETSQEDEETGDQQVEDSIPNNMGDVDEEEAQVEGWFPLVSKEIENRLQEPSNNIHLYPGLTTRMIHSRGQEKIAAGGTFYSACFERQTLLEAATDQEPNDPFVSSKKIGVWADKRDVQPHLLQPGDVIRAIHSVAQNNIKQPYPSPYVRIFEHGPVYSKVRPFIILTKNEEGMICLPLFSGNWIKKNRATYVHKHEYMTVRTPNSKYPSDWAGYTPANGKPLSIVPSSGVDFFKPESFVDICRPVYISKSEAVQYTQGMLPREDFVRLMEAYTYKENLAKSMAMGSVCCNYPVEQPPPQPLPATFKSGKGEAEKVARKRYAAFGLKPEEIDKLFV